jgi:hypothetical protein
MNARRPFTSDQKSLIANNSRGQRLLAVVLISAAILFFAAAEFAFAGPGHSGGTDPRMTGLSEFTQEELQWQNKHHKRLKKVKLNKIGLKRVNEKRRMKGRKALVHLQRVIVWSSKKQRHNLTIKNFINTA